MPTTNRAARLRFDAQVAEYMQRIGERIAQRRKELGLSQGALARKLPGTTDGNQVSRWERGLHKPSDDTLEAIAQALGVEDVSYFLVSEPAGGPTPDPFADISVAGNRDRLDSIERKLNALIRFQLAVTTTTPGLEEELLSLLQAETDQRVPESRGSSEEGPPAAGAAGR